MFLGKWIKIIGVFLGALIGIGVGLHHFYLYFNDQEAYWAPYTKYNMPEFIAVAFAIFVAYFIVREIRGTSKGDDDIDAGTKKERLKLRRVQHESRKRSSLPDHPAYDRTKSWAVFEVFAWIWRLLGRIF